MGCGCGNKNKAGKNKAALMDPKHGYLKDIEPVTEQLNQKEGPNLLQKALNIISQDRTTIVIAHRLSTVRNADNIIVLGNNNIVESGNHNELVLKDGTYKKLWDIQTGKTSLD